MDAYYHSTTTTRATAKGATAVDAGPLTSKEGKKVAASPTPLALNSYTATTFTHSIGGQKKKVKKERPGIVMPPGLGSHNKVRRRTTSSMDYFTKAVTTNSDRQEATTNEGIEDYQ